jgi:lysophospholipase L1-like esterase
MKNDLRTPFQVALFFLSLIFVFGVSSYFNPSSEIPINNHFTIRTPQWKNDVIEPIAVKKDDSELIERPDSLLFKIPVKKTKPIVQSYKSQPKSFSNIRFSDSDDLRFQLLYESLRNLQMEKASNKSIRILHYGDSQIEGDRTTREIRNFFQEKYGGTGTGFQNMTPFVPMAAVAHKTDGKWVRMTSFGRQDQRQSDGRYGVTGIANRFNSRVDGKYDAFINFYPRSYGYKKAREFSKFQLFHGPLKDSLKISWFINDTLNQIQLMDTLTDDSKLVVRASEPIKELRIEFKGASPDFYGISLDGKSGVNVDNISMRGSSGISFTQMDESHFKKELSNHEIALIILQFGGNSVPYFKTKESVKSYGQSFQRQIQLFKRLVPSASILVVGPSDMASKKGLKWLSYPIIREVRNTMMNVAFDERVGYFDLCGFMGGEGSMVEWVNKSPPLAGPDHIHFTRRGAKKVGIAIANAIKQELDRYE